MLHGADSMNDSNKKPMRQTCQPHGYVCTLVTYDILSTPWVIHNLSGLWNELVCHPRECYLLSPHGVFPCCELCHTHGWHIVSAHKALTLTLFCVNSISETNRLPMQYFNQSSFQPSHGWCRRIKALLDEPVATNNMGVLADDCMSIHVHVLHTWFGSDFFILFYNKWLISLDSILPLWQI